MSRASVDSRKAALLHDVSSHLASSLSFDDRLARVSYALLALNPQSMEACIWLGRCLLRSGDAAGAKEIFSYALGLAMDEEEQRAIVSAYAREKRTVQQDGVSAGATLAGLRARGWAGVKKTIEFAHIMRPGRRCPKCSGYGQLHWYRHQHSGRCYECNGTGLLY